MFIGEQLFCNPTCGYWQIRTEHILLSWGPQFAGWLVVWNMILFFSIDWEFHHPEAIVLPTSCRSYFNPPTSRYHPNTQEPPAEAYRAQQRAHRSATTSASPMLAMPRQECQLQGGRSQSTMGWGDSYWLVVSNVNFICHNMMGIILPIDEVLFFKMVKTTNQLKI